MFHLRRKETNREAAAATKERIDVGNLFDKCAFNYTRAEAVKQGLLVELMEPPLVHAVWGSDVPYSCTMTRDAFQSFVGEPTNPATNQNAGLVRDIMAAFLAAIHTEVGTPWHRLRFAPDPATPGRQLEAVWHNGDKGETVITFMVAEK